MSDSPTIGDTARNVRVGEVLNYYVDRRKRGQAEPQAQFLADHPDIADDLREMLETVSSFKTDEAVLDSLIRQGVLEGCDELGYIARCGKYKISSVIGRGGMGVVFKAYEPALERTVALKILRPDWVSDATAVARFVREAKAAARLRHPNIVTIHAVGQEGAAYYLAMEYIDGHGGGSSLADLISEHGPLPTDTARSIFRQLLLGLAAAHDAGLIHRDIKPGNILLDCGLPIGDCRFASAAQSPIVNPQSPIDNSQSSIVNLKSSIVKIADFGLARMISAETRMTLPDSVFGTPEYMSPEQARGDADIDRRTDLYSAGVVLFEMTTGQTPFKAPTPTAVVHKILSEDPPDPKTINPHADPNLAALALRLMAKQPEDRFASASDAIEALDSDARVQSPVRRRKMRRRVRTTLIGVMLAVVGVWLVSTLLLGPDSITDARLDPDTRRAIQVRYGDDPDWKTFKRYPTDSAIELTEPVLVDVDGSGTRFIVVGSATPFDDKNNVLIAYDRSAEEKWRIALHSELDWPDISSLKKWWEVLHVIHADVDGVPGEELVVVASDPEEYPTRISVIDPQTGEIPTSYWNPGDIRDIRLIPYFDDGRPTIVAWGYNNKLDGYDDGLRDGKKQLTNWRIVSVLMILDPMDMDGLGPPYTKRLPLPKARPLEYAFLDMPYARGVADVPVINAGEKAIPANALKPSYFAEVYEVRPALRRSDEDGSDTCLRIVIHWGREDAEGFEYANLTVDRHLNLRLIEPVRWHEDAEKVKEHWDRYWTPIIQDGKPVGRYAEE